MDANYPYKIVDFTYCNTCKFRDVKDEIGEEPCNECLAEPVNLNSIKPIKYEKNEKIFTFNKLKQYTFNAIKKFTFGKLIDKK